MMGEKTNQLIKSIFNLDNPFMKVCERIFDWVVLNLLFLLTCLPIVTIGVAKLSLYRVLLDMKQQQHVPIISLYFAYFKSHLKNGLKLGIIELVVSLVCWGDFILFSHIQANWARGLQMICIGLWLLLAMIFLYVYPLSLRMEGSLKSRFIAAFILASLNFVKTFLMLGMMVSLLMILYLSPLTFLLGVSLMLIIGFSGLHAIYLYVIEGILNKYSSDFIKFDEGD